MIRHDDVGTRRNFQLADGYSFFFHTGKLFQENLRIYDDTAANDACFIREQDSRRQKAQCKGTVIYYYRMACIIAAL